jgi:hypothetical protein
MDILMKMKSFAAVPQGARPQIQLSHVNFVWDPPALVGLSSDASTLAEARATLALWRPLVTTQNL